MEEAKKPMGWKELYLKEDWWAIYLGLGNCDRCHRLFLYRESLSQISECFAS
jgi:hypothetical protein